MVNIRNDAWLIVKGAIEHLISIYRNACHSISSSQFEKTAQHGGVTVLLNCRCYITCFVDVMPQLHSSYLVGGFNLSEKY